MSNDSGTLEFNLTCASPGLHVKPPVINGDDDIDASVDCLSIDLSNVTAMVVLVGTSIEPFVGPVEMIRGGVGIGTPSVVNENWYGSFIRFPVMSFTIVEIVMI